MFKNKSKTVFIIMVGSELHVFLLVLWKTKEIKKSIFSDIKFNWEFRGIKKTL